MRPDGRLPNELRPVSIERRYTDAAPGSVLIAGGRTRVLCTASIEEAVPGWKANAPDAGGWVTAEYSMLPGSTSPRARRERGQVGGRTSEIQRLIGRSLRAVVDLAALGPRTITVDCDVLRADGGTRTLSITGGFVALVDAVASLRGVLPDWRRVFRDSVAAVSLGVVEGEIRLDLDYAEDSAADVDFNVVMTGAGRYVEVQGTAERQPFSRAELENQLALAAAGIAELTALQRDVLSAEWPLESPGHSC